MLESPTATAEVAEDPNLTRIEVITPQPVTILSPAQAALERAKAFVIADQEDCEIAAVEGKGAKARYDALEAQRVNLKKPIDEAAARIQALFKPPLELWSAVQKTYASKMAEWNAEQTRIAAEARAKAEREAREAAAKLAREAAALEAKGRVEEAAAKVEQAEALQLAPVVVDEPAKVEGVSYATIYKARVVNLLVFLKAAIKNPMLLALVRIDEAALNGMARSTKESFSIPGCELIVERQTRLRG